MHCLTACLQIWPNTALALFTVDVPRPDYVTVLNTNADLTVTKLIKEILISYYLGGS
jgi:hypothetical protein